MLKKSVTRMENENESSRAELSNPVLQDIIATNHVVLAKKPRQDRLSRACKAVIIMIILGLVAIGIIVLTLVLAQSRNTLLAITSRSADGDALPASNHSRVLLVHQENLTTVANEQSESDNWSRSPVILTSNNLRPLTTEQNVHISSSIMRTEQQNGYISSTAQSMKPLSSSPIRVNEQSTTIQTTVSNEETTSGATSHQSTTLMMTEQESMTATTSEDFIQTSFNSPMMSTVDDTSSSNLDYTTSIPEENSFTTFMSRHFNIQTSTVTTNNAAKKTNDVVETFKYKAGEDDDMDDLLFS